MTTSQKGNQGIRQLIKAIGYSLKGFYAAWRNEAAFREETLVAAILIPLAFFITTNHLERLLLISSLLLVLLVELINSAIEAVVDRVAPNIMS